jgi:hypothetical protein
MAGDPDPLSRFHSAAKESFSFFNGIPHHSVVMSTHKRSTFDAGVRNLAGHAKPRCSAETLLG